MAVQKSLMIIIEKNADGKVSNVGRKFLLDQISALTPEAMAAGFGATIRELEAQIDGFNPMPPTAGNPPTPEQIAKMPVVSEKEPKAKKAAAA